MAAVHDQIGRFPVQQMNGSQCAGERSPHESEVSLLAEQMFRQIMIPFFLIADLRLRVQTAVAGEQVLAV